jgi:hypothetical protein
MTSSISTPNFINRQQELAFLDKTYQQATKQGQLVIIYGKRRIGKTELIKHFAQDKPHLYYLASRGDKKDQLRTVTRLIKDYFQDDFLSPDAFASWRQLFQYLGKKLPTTQQATGRSANTRADTARQPQKKQSPLILTFDEFPYLVEAEEAMASYFQYGWDEQLKNKQVMLVLMGSSIAMMYDHTLSQRSPLYGRRTAQWRLEPFTFQEAKKFLSQNLAPQASSQKTLQKTLLKNAASKDHAQKNSCPDSLFRRIFSLYALVGGVPAYLQQLNANLSLKQNIKQNFFTKGAFLHLEPELLLADEFQQPQKYLSILKAIGLGRTKYSELLNLTGFDNSTLPSYLKRLLDLRLITKQVPITIKNPQKSRRGHYSITDKFLRFYFTLVYPYLSRIESDATDSLLAEKDQLLNQLIAQSYEDTTAQFIRQAIKQQALPHFDQMGRWWNKKTEIDLVALKTTSQASHTSAHHAGHKGTNKHKNTTKPQILFTETKWSNQAIGARTLRQLRQKSQELSWHKKDRQEFFALVSRSGFTQNLISQAQAEPRLILIEKDQLHASCVED